MFYKGVIEDNKDPLQAGRVRVRIFELHTADKKALPTAHLPWASVDAPNLLGGLIQGMGISSILRQGLWVRVYFETEYGVELYDKPVVASVITGIFTTPGDTSMGFCDPDGVYPMKDRLNVPDMSTSARSSGIVKKNSSINTANGEESQKPSTYRDGFIIETPGGHSLELDDTSGNKRVQILHTTGTYIEMNTAGSIIEKIVNEKLEMILSNYNLYIDGNQKIRLKGNKDDETLGNVNVKVSGNVDVKISGNETNVVSGNSTERISGNKQIQSAKLMLN